MRELVFDCLREQAELWSDALLDAGALAVTVGDADLGKPEEQPLYGEPGLEPEVPAWNRNRVVALLADDTDPGALIQDACTALSLAVAPAWSLREVPDEDWVRLTQSQFDPIHVSGIWIVPSWHQVPAEAGSEDVIIRLDPGLAFGTGSHPTTHLCLDWLAQNLPPQARVLDYGCGSGILAIAALLLGAERAVGTDIDPQALEASRDNANRNGIDPACFPLYLPQDLPNEQADVVVANILAGPLVQLAPQITGLVRPGGRLALSGILAEQADEVRAAYADAFDLDPTAEQEGWVRISGVRR